MGERVLLVGASVRALAASAVRAGLEPMALDLFCDRDLQACPALRVPPHLYPAGLPRLAAKLPAAPLVYSGGLENHPRVLAALARDRPLWGNPPAVVRRVRDPFRLRRALERAGVPCPRVAPGRGPPPPGAWLEKPLRGAGGRGIRRASTRARAGGRRAGGPGKLRAAVPGKRPCYYQEYVEGTSASAAYLGRDGGAMLLGLTRQIVGDPAFGAPPFAYAGSIGPLRPSARLRARLEQLGAVLAREFGLLGLFGVDLVLRGGVPWPVEVNPRPTASLEVLEEALGFSAMALHRSSFTDGPAPPRAVLAVPRARRLIGKAVVRARRDVVVPAGTLTPRARDLPWPGERIRAGRPVLTVFVRGATVESCRRSLARVAARVLAMLERSP